MNGVSNKLVSAVIVAFGKSGCFESCLDSLKRQRYPGLEVIVIDNSSGRNLFYCGALNKGIGMSRGDFVLCLNDDAVLDKEFIGKALRGFSRDARVGMVSGKILRPDGKTIDSTGLFLSPFRTAKERGYGKPDTGKFEKEGYIFGVSGAVAFYRRDMLEEIKRGSEYFDSAFNFFYEDLDIAWRAQNSGWRGYYVPQAIAYHVRGSSVRKSNGLNKKFARHYLSDNLYLDLVKNRYLTIIKNENFWGLLLHLPLIVIYDFFVYCYTLFFKFPLLKTIIRKFVDGRF